MNTYQLKIASPDGTLFHGEAVSLSLRGTEGDLAVMAGHIPFVTGVRPCECRLVLPDETVMVGHTDGGLLTVGAEETILLSGSFQWKDQPAQK